MTPGTVFKHGSICNSSGPSGAPPPTAHLPSSTVLKLGTMELFLGKQLVISPVDSLYAHGAKRYNHFFVLHS